MTALDFSEDQVRAQVAIRKWCAETETAALPRGRAPLLRLGGFAGSGKTTLTATLVGEWIEAGESVCCCTYTGKAALVLSRALERFGVLPTYVGTIHRLIYVPETDEHGRVVGWKRAETLDYDRIVIDEASMIPQELYDDLASYGIPILAVGDHGQLPPVGEDMGLMASPDVRLERIHRQAAGNPIIAVATAIRSGIPLDTVLEAIAQTQTYDPRVRTLRGKQGIGEALTISADPSSAFVITFTNAARCSLNSLARRVRGLDPESDVQPGESVICLRNHYEPGREMIANGMRGIVETVERRRTHWLRCRVAFEDGRTLTVDALAAQFGRATFSRYDEIREAGGPRIYQWAEAGTLLDFGYVMTCHKSQGSQAERVAVYVEKALARLNDDEYRRWLYTACTRAVSELLLVLP